jgi:hypothetical protein
MTLYEKKRDNIADFISAWKQWDTRWDFSYRHGGAFSNRFSDAGYPSVSMNIPLQHEVEVKTWLNENFGNNYFMHRMAGAEIFRILIFFNTEQDKVLFILRWS